MGGKQSKGHAVVTGAYLGFCDISIRGQSFCVVLSYWGPFIRNFHVESGSRVPALFGGFGLFTG